MKKLMVIAWILCLQAPGVAGFKSRIVKPKSPEKFHSYVTVAGITFASDLLLEVKEQKKYFYEGLTPHDVVALRLAIFNNSSKEVVLPLEGIRLICPDGKELFPIGPEIAARAVLEGKKATAGVGEPKVRVGTREVIDNRRMDKSSPDYDPRLDPTDPAYDPNDPRNRRYNRLPGAPQTGVHVDVNPYGNESGALTKGLIEMDFTNKAYSGDPIPPSMRRDRFLFFTIADPPAAIKGFELRLPQCDGLPAPVILKFR